MDRFLNQVFWGDAGKLLPALPTASIDACICDPMYGVAKDPTPKAAYDWGVDPAGGDPDKWWAYHGPMYRECLRVLKPGGILAWAQGCKFRKRFPHWFGGNRIWSLTRFNQRGLNAFGHIWVVQTQGQSPVPFPDKDSLILLGPKPKLLTIHPCPKSVEEMRFIVENLTNPNDIVLDCFAGTGSTLVAAQQLGRRWIGCDLSKNYCRVALQRLRQAGCKGS
jgi:DNA modification methylase